MTNRSDDPRSSPRSFALPKPPHPATVIQPRVAITPPSTRPPHPATVIQPKVAITPPSPRPPHPATVIQPKVAITPPAARPPHPATVAQARLLPPSFALQRFGSGDAEWKPVTNKKKVKKALKQQEQKDTGARTRCVATDGKNSVEAVSGDMTNDVKSTLGKFAPKLAAHLADTDNEEARTAYVCAEPNAVMMLIDQYHPDLASIRVSMAWDEVGSYWKEPCGNCSTWLEATGAEKSWGFSSGSFNAPEYKIKADFI